MRSPVPARQRFRPGIDEIPDDVLEQIAHAGDCAVGFADELEERLRGINGDGVTAVRHALDGDDDWMWFRNWAEWKCAARSAARLLGVEVR